MTKCVKYLGVNGNMGTYYHGSPYPVRRRGIKPQSVGGIHEYPDEPREKAVYLTKDINYAEDFGRGSGWHEKSGRTYDIHLSKREEKKLKMNEALGEGFEYTYPDRIRPSQIRTHRKKCSGTGCENFF